MKKFALLRGNIEFGDQLFSRIIPKFLQHFVFSMCVNVTSFKYDYFRYNMNIKKKSTF